MEFDNVVTGIMEINSSDGREYLQQPKMFYLCSRTVRRGIENNSVAGWCGFNTYYGSFLLSPAPAPNITS